MKHLWAHEELIGNFTLSKAELKLLVNKTNVSKLGLAILLESEKNRGSYATNL